MSVLIHIGYPKAGSTFLQSWFSRHPDIFFNANFLSTYSSTGQIPQKSIPDLNDKKHFVISEEQLVLWQGKIDLVGMKFTPFDIRSQQKKVAERLFQNYPGAKVLIVTRGFESMLLSMYSQYVTMGGILNFTDYQKEMAKHLSVFYDYTYVVNLYRNIFNPENVLVLPFEMLKENAENFITTIQQQTGIENNPGFKFEKVNPSIDAKLFPAYRGVSKFLYLLLHLLPYSVRLKIYLAYVNALSEKKLNGLINLLSKFGSDHSYMVREDTLKLFEQKAGVLEHEKLFCPYLKEYLL